jgi:hypothetical protein
LKGSSLLKRIGSEKREEFARRGYFPHQYFWGKCRPKKGHPLNIILCPKKGQNGEEVVFKSLSERVFCSMHNLSTKSVEKGRQKDTEEMDNVLFACRLKDLEDQRPERLTLGRTAFTMFRRIRAREIAG